MANEIKQGIRISWVGGGSIHSCASLPLTHNRDTRCSSPSSLTLGRLTRNQGCCWMAAMLMRVAAFATSSCDSSSWQGAEMCGATFDRQKGNCSPRGGAVRAAVR